MAAEFTQDNINALTQYILDNEKLKSLIYREDWKSLFEELYNRAVHAELKAEYNFQEGDFCYFGFLYHYFLQLDNFNILKIVEEIPTMAFFFRYSSEFSRYTR